MLSGWLYFVWWHLIVVLPSVQNLLHGTFLVPKILKQLGIFGKFMYACFKHVLQNEYSTNTRKNNLWMCVVLQFGVISFASINWHVQWMKIYPVRYAKRHIQKPRSFTVYTFLVSPLLWHCVLYITHHSAIFLWQRMTLFSMSIGW